MNQRTAPPPPKEDMVKTVRRLLEEKLSTMTRDELTLPSNIGQALETIMRDEFGGELIYCAVGERYRVEAMRQDVRARWNGQNTHELAKQWQVTDRRIYQIGSEMRFRGQPDLFGGAGEKAA